MTSKVNHNAPRRTEQVELDSRGPEPGSPRSKPRRTTFHRDGVHVGTIIEYFDERSKGSGFCVWSTKHHGDRAPDYATAYAAMVKKIE